MSDVPTQQRARIADVAREAGVSKAAVSFAFNNPARLASETAERILSEDKRVERVWRDEVALWLRGPKEPVLRVQPKRLQQMHAVAQDLVEVGPGQTVTANFTLEPRAISMEAVVATGVAAETPQNQLAFLNGEGDVEAFAFRIEIGEIENALLRHPDITQAAVIGIPDERLGEVGMAFVVTRSGDRGAGPAIVAWAREQMANYKVPRAVEVVDALPLNATGKVEKNVLRARAAAPADGPVSA